MTLVTDGYAPALAGLACRRYDDDGRCSVLPVHRWHGRAERAARRMLGRCQGATVDVGCGPGRLTGALAARGVPALGIDVSGAAVRLTRSRGAAALRRSVFDPLPHEGRWRHVLLADGNIGIGGDPGALLRRCARLLDRRGTLLVEVDRPGAGLWCGQARLEHPDGHSTRFPWARVDLDAVPALAAGAHLAVRDVLHCDDRWFVELAATR
jgi:SAM-dependent methyltransferase